MRVRSAGLGLASMVVLVGAGAAQGLSGVNTVFSDDIVDGTIKHADVKPNSLGGSRLLDNAVTGSKILNNTVTGADIADLGWLTLPLYSVPPLGANTAWGDGYAVPRFAKDAQGMVHLDGLVKLGSLPGPSDYFETVGTLPAGYRPAAKVIGAVLCGAFEGATMRMDVEPSGRLFLWEGDECDLAKEAPTGARFVSLTGFRFPAAS
jgi:hypothetical protein